MIDRKANRTYSIEEKTTATALALSIGPLRAAKQLSIPPRTVAAWTSGERSAKTRRSWPSRAQRSLIVSGALSRRQWRP
jgi:transposase-like protein